VGEVFSAQRESTPPVFFICTSVSDAIAPLLPSVAWQQNQAEYWWEG